MKIHFHLYYATTYGENLLLRAELHRNGKTLARDFPLDYLNESLWHVMLDLDEPGLSLLRYHYVLQDENGQQKDDWGARTLDLSDPAMTTAEVFDYWNPPGAVENAFTTQPFHYFLPKRATADKKKKSAGSFTHTFRVKAPLLGPDEAVCLLGHGTALRAWDVKAPLLLQPDKDGGWSLQLDLSKEEFPLAYKYGVWNARTRSFEGFEQGGNRALYPPAAPNVILHDGFARFPAGSWRGAGVAIPVFSLRSNQGFGVGEFTDLPALADWAKSTGLKMIQLLPINDTSATGTRLDSYPYAAISAFALHPLYLNVAEVAGAAQAAILKPYARQQKALNALPAVDYEAVMQVKWEIILKLYAAQKNEFLTDPEFIRYFTENKHWLAPYAAFCYLRDENGTPDFNRWPSDNVYREKSVENLVTPGTAHYDKIAIHYFVQWHLHRQLRAAVDYLHERGLALKGDIPIGIYRFSCDAWVAPELYNMDMQAGAPPDDFAVNGQNWGFPTYNWTAMKADGFAWWRRRFQQMSAYFDAFRIDHILGFFRIWSIPMHAVEGILGYFVPAIPVTEREFHAAGIGFHHERLSQPFINDAILHDLFNGQAAAVRDYFLDATPDGGHWSGLSQYAFKPAFDTQRKVELHLKNLAGDTRTTKRKTKAARPAFVADDSLQQKLFNLLANVILIDVTPAGASEKQYAFRINAINTRSFQFLPDEVKKSVENLYVNYFFRRQDDFWQREALEKLPALKRASNMLICGEDLGMVPHCVPDVMQELGLLSLEIQRMPKKTGSTFFHPKDAPYLSVVTPSTHDMSTVRGWWEEDRSLTQQFFNEILGYEGAAPYFCEHWINRVIVAQHLNSPAMWAIFQLQDLLGMDAGLRRENPHDERINIPANPKHYWRYRMHLTLEDLQKANGFNAALREMVAESRR